MDGLILIPIAVLLLFGVPLLALLVLAGLWLRRSGRESALRTFLGFAVSSVVALLALTGTVLMIVTLAWRNHQHGHEAGGPAVVLLVGLGLLVLLALLASLVFGVWTTLRAIEARPAAQVPPPVPGR